MARAVVLALLALLALPVGVAGAPAAGGPSGAVVGSIDDVAILTLNGSARTSFATPSMDVATAVAIQRGGAAARLDQLALKERLAAASSNDEREQLLFEAATAAEIRIADLRDEQRALRSAYVDREIDTATFVRRLALLHTRADRLRTRLAAIGAQADRLPRFSMNSRIQLLESKLIGSRGPVRERATAALRGDEPPARLYVSASVDGHELAMLQDGRYVRAAYRSDLQTPDSVSSFSLDAADSRAFSLYPVAYNDSRQPGFGQNIDGTIGGNIYLVQLTFPSGSVNAYLDDGTRTVFFEIHERRLDLLGPRPGTEATANGTRLVVNRSFPGGPLEVTVTDNATGEPVSATVLVDGARFETGPDGSVWTLGPASVTFDVTAVRPGGNVTVSVRPLVPATVTGEG